MKVVTTRFGVIDVDDSSAINLVWGLLGFESCKRYCLYRHRPDVKFWWLQSLEDPGLAFVVIDPSEYFADYEFEMSDADAAKIRLSRPEDAMTLAIVTIPKNAEEATVNLAAPIVINSRERIGIQAVSQDNKYLTKEPLGRKQVQQCKAKDSQACTTSAATKAA